MQKWYVIARETYADGEKCLYPILIYPDKERAKQVMRGASAEREKFKIMEVSTVITDVSPKELAAEAMAALKNDTETPDEHFDRLIEKGFINEKGEVLIKSKYLPGQAEINFEEEK